MSILQCVDKYVALKRTLGFKYRVQGILLKNYATFAQDRGDSSSRSIGYWSGAGKHHLLRKRGIVC